MPAQQTYNQYTRCVQPANYTGPYLATTGFYAAIAGSIALFIAGIFLDPGIMTLGAIAIGIAYCQWWLYGRLVCLGGNKCLIGLVLDIDTQQDQSGGLGQLDTDVSLNLLLAPDPFRGDADPNWLAKASINNQIQGKLINTTLASLGATNYPFPLVGEPLASSKLLDHDGFKLLSTADANALNLPNPSAWQVGVAYNPGDQVLDSNNNIQNCTSNPGAVSGPAAPVWGTAPGAITYDGAGLLIQWVCAGPLPIVPALEVEFEGAGVWDVYQALQIAIGIAAAGTVVGALKWLAPLVAALCAIPIFGWIVCAIAAAAFAIAAALAVASAIAAGVGLYEGGSDNSAEANVKKNVGVLHPGASVVFVMGTWVYDSGHTGWNELHPVLFCQKIDHIHRKDLLAGTPWINHPSLQAPHLKHTLDKHCGLATKAIAPATVAAQALPENGWKLHPLVDGCTAPPAPLA